MIDLGFIHEVLLDAQHEMGEPEIAELVTPALDRKVERAIEMLEQELTIEETK